MNTEWYYFKLEDNMYFKDDRLHLNRNLNLIDRNGDITVQNWKDKDIEIIYYDCIFVIPEEMSTKLIFEKIIDKEIEIKKYIYQEKDLYDLLAEFDNKDRVEEVDLHGDELKRYVYLCIKTPSKA